MQLGISIDPRSPEMMRQYYRAAEEAGIDLFALPDSQSMYREVYAMLGMAAERTDTPRLTTLTTNPVTRHPAVTAAAISTVDEISGGRATLGIATGDSAVRNTELDVPGLGEVREAVELIRHLCRGDTVEYHGETIRIRWADQDVPIFVVGEGPQMLSLGGHVGDGVFYGGWNTPEAIEWALSRVEIGKQRDDRDADDVEFWSVSGGAIAPTRADAIDDLSHILSASAHVASKGDLEEVPDEMVEPLRRLGADYRPDLHNQYDEPYNASLLDKHGVREFMADHWTVAGTADQVRDQLLELDEQGVDGVIMLLRIPDPLPTIKRLGEDVIPALS